MKTCETCAAFFTNSPDLRPLKGQCRLRPPVVVVGIYGRDTSFPAVDGEEWCLEWKAPEPAQYAEQVKP